MAGFADLFNSEELSDVLLHISTDATENGAKVGEKRKASQGEMETEYARSFHVHGMILYQSEYFKVSRAGRHDRFVMSGNDTDIPFSPEGDASAVEALCSSWD